MPTYVIPTDVTVRTWAILTEASAAASVGVVFGYLYWKRGLEAAMIAHGTADVVMHVGRPLVQTRKA